MEAGGRFGVYGRRGPRRPRLAQLGSRALLPLLERLAARYGIVGADSEAAKASRGAIEEALAAGRPAYLLGIGIGLHNAGAALVRVSTEGTMELLCNEEEERYAGVKHFCDYPEQAVAAVRRRLDDLGVEPADLAACVSSWDYPALAVSGVRPVLEEAPVAPFSLDGARHAVSEEFFKLIRASADRLAGQLGLARRLPIIGMRHHDAHAYFSYAVSPFAREPEPTMVLVLDGSGDDASTSLYEARAGELTLLEAQGSNIVDSLGTLYGFISSTQGGWPVLSSEGRYMGAAAWGDGNRLTNRYYRRLRQILHFGADGEVRVNRALANWTRAGWVEPYSEELIDILGEPIPVERMWHPDAVLNVEDVRHPEVTRDRVDKAAALQMVFEDGLAHTVDNLIRRTGSDRLVLTGGTALNCVANMRLLDNFDEHWYARQLDKEGRFLRLWVPPMPGDAGTPAGAAFAFAMKAGARPGEPLRHAFYCGSAPAGVEIEAAVDAAPEAEMTTLGDCSSAEGRAKVADLLARLIAENCIVGLYQGASETGPRALGHRSVLANPRNPETRRLLNERVKHRELIRPLAPMVTRAAAERLFELQPGASAGDYSAYNYMVLTARAKPEALELIPSAIHHDGTGRLQIVRPEADPFCHAYLVAMGRRIGVEASVNTSLNVGAPIAHTPEQAMETLRRAKGMDGLLTIDAIGQARLVWLRDRNEAQERLLGSLERWEAGAA